MLKQSPDTRFLDWKVENTAHHIAQIIKRLPFVEFKQSKRMVCTLGASYAYSGQISHGVSFDHYPPLKALMERLNSELGTSYNSILVNWYPKDANAGIGKHSDNEKELVAGQPVASVSLGCSVDFLLSHNSDPEKISVTLNDGDIFIMGQDCQKHYQHAIGYMRMPDDRISLTFREFKTK